MNQRVRQWWSDFKKFDWKMYLALCLLALVPAIYQTVITKLITSFASPGSLDIIGQMEWYDLIDETICAFLIVPMYSVLSKAYKKEGFNKVVFKLGLIVVVLYALFNIGTFFFGIHMVSFMNPNEIDIGAAYRYLSLETIAFMIGIVFSFVSVVFLVIDKPKYMYAFLVAKILLSLLSDLALVPGMGVDGIAIGNIIANTLMGGLGIALLIYEKQIKPAKYGKEDLPNLKDWGRVGLFAGGQQFLDNIIYALMICRMVNAVAESGNYWVSNNFIWGWLLIPVTCLVEIIRKDAGADGYSLRQKNYYSIITFVLIAWFALIPTYQWFFGTVEGIENPGRIFEIVVKNLGFYVAYAYSQVPDAIFVGMGKTKYNAINSLICNIVYYGIWFILYKTGVVVMNMDMIVIMFGCGNITHWVVSLIEEKVFLVKEIRNFNSKVRAGDYMKEIHVTKKQHFVPREYLRPWCFANEQIWCSINKAKTIQSNLMGVGNQNYFYKFNPNFSDYEAELARKLFEKEPNPSLYSYWIDKYEMMAKIIKQASSDVQKKKICEDFEKQIEEEINCKLEQGFYPILHRLQQGDTSFYNTNPTSENDPNTDTTVDFLYGLMEINLRTKNMKNSVVGNIAEGAAEQKVNPDNLWMLTRHQFATLLGYILLVKHFNLFILEDETNSLITGDQPVFNSKPNFVNGEATELEYYCPLSPSKALLLTLDKTVQRKMTIEKRDFYNRLVRDSSEMQIYSNSKEVLDYVISL